MSNLCFEKGDPLNVTGNKYLQSILISFTVIAISTGAFGQAKAIQPKYVFPIDASWLSPLFIEARVNGSESMRFILDSASTWSMIRRAEAESLHLKTTRTNTATGGGGEFP